MVSVTQRIKQIKQPRGGYLPVKTFTVTTLDDGQVLNPEESIAASLVGTAVDYLSRFMDGTSVEESFEVSLLGARAMRMEAKAFGLLDDVKGLDDLSITKVRLVSWQALIVPFVLVLWLIVQWRRLFQIRRLLLIFVSWLSVV